MKQTPAWYDTVRSLAIFLIAFILLATLAEWSGTAGNIGPDYFEPELTQKSTVPAER